MHCSSGQYVLRWLLAVWFFLASTGAEIGHTHVRSFITNDPNQWQVEHSDRLNNTFCCDDSTVDQLPFDAELVIFGVEIPVSHPVDPSSPTLISARQKVDHAPSVELLFSSRLATHFICESVVSNRNSNISAPLCFMALRLQTGVFRI